MWLNSEIQSQRLEFEIRSNENAFIAQFLDNALDEKLEKRRDFAEYFMRLAPTQESRARWTEYRDYAQSLVVRAQQKEDEIAAQKLELAKLKSMTISSGSVSAGTGSAASGASASGAADNAALHEKIIGLQAVIDRQRRELAVIRSEPVSLVVQVPDVIGLAMNPAQQLIEQAGLSAWFEDGGVSEGVPPEHVVRVSPAPGTWIPRDGSVRVFVTPDIPD